MSCYDLCPPRTSVAVPQPIAESCNELCARQCPDSSAFIQPPPVVVTFPGPILSSFPQQAVVGSSGAPAFGGSLGLGGLYGAGATQASGGLCTFGRAYAAPACSPCALPRYSKKLWTPAGPARATSNSPQGPDAASAQHGHLELCTSCPGLLQPVTPGLPPACPPSLSLPLLPLGAQ
ncbi:scale keratin-like [Molothrus ater]|nr:scale keratin-like [Molothrus ater]